MRSSNRITILDAAVRVIEASGVTALTLESVAEAAGLTKGGLMYHFPTREALLTGIHHHLAQKWEGRLGEALEEEFASASSQAKLTAYARVSMESATRAELMLILEGASTAHAEPWNAVLQRWTAEPRDALATGPIDHVIARLAADGLWLYDAISGTQLDPGTRMALTERLAEMIKTPGDLPEGNQ